MAAGSTPAECVLTVLAERFPPVRESETEPGVASGIADFERFFGCVQGRVPGGLDNEAIDADLAREYASDYKDE